MYWNVLCLRSYNKLFSIEAWHRFANSLLNKAKKKKNKKKKKKNKKKKKRSSERAFEHKQNMWIYIIRKVSSGSLHTINTFNSIQYIWQRTPKALIGFGPSLSAVPWMPIFAWHGSIIINMINRICKFIQGHFSISLTIRFKVSLPMLQHVSTYLIKIPLPQMFSIQNYVCIRSSIILINRHNNYSRQS